MAGSLGLRNIDATHEEWLAKIGVDSKEEFEHLGAEKIYVLLAHTGHEPDAELRFRLLGAEQDLDWHIIEKREQHRAKSPFADVDEP